MSQAARGATSDELAILRTPGDWTRAYLGIYKPNVIYTALLNGAPASTDIVGQITFDGGSGTLSNVKAEMTLWVGTSAGARDLGTCRIRKAASGSIIYIGYTSEINWEDNCYLTVVDHAMLSKKPVLIDAGVTKMDGEHTYSDQHTVFDPAPVLTPHAVAMLTGATVDVIFAAGDSWVYGSTITGYAWTAPGASASSGMATSTATITYNAAGYYRVQCVVTAANGKTATGVRFVMVFDSTHKPHSVDVQPPSADYDSGGWSFSVKMHSDADPANVIEGALAILFGDDHYGSTQQSIGQVENRENIICWGYIAGESIEWDVEISAVEFEVQGPQYWLKEIEANPTALSFATNTPALWDVMPALTVDRALWHILHWRSNATALLSVTLTGDARYAPRIESMDASLWSQMNEIAYSKIFGRIGCDRYGRFFAVVDPQCVPEASRTWATVMTITKKDWKERVGITRSAQRKLAMVSTSGWLVDAGGAVNTLYSLAMGHIHAQTGGGEIIDQLLATSQAQFNELAGLYLGWKNNELEFEFSLPQNNRMIDLWPNQFLDVSLIAGDTPRGIAYAGNLIPRSITLQPDPDSGSWSTDVTCEAETFAELAVNGDVPASTGIDNFDSSFPPMSDFPSMPNMPWSELPPTVTNANHPHVVVMATSQGVIYTKDFSVDNPVWAFMNNGLDSTDRTTIGQIVVTPNGKIFVMCNGVSSTGWLKIYCASGLGGTFTLVYDTSALAKIIHGMGFNPLKSEELGILGGSYGAVENTGEFLIGNSAGFTLKANLTVRSPNYTSVVFCGNNWFVYHQAREGFGGIFHQPIVERYSAAGSYEYERHPLRVGWFGNAAANQYAKSAGLKDTVFHWGNVSGGSPTMSYDVITAKGVTETAGNATFLPVDSSESFSPSPTGTHIMAASGGSITPYKTTDSGGTWSSVAGTVPIGSDVWENCRDNNRWIFGGGTTIRVTTDQGASYFDKMGNLGYIAPLVDITHIRFIS